MACPDFSSVVAGFGGSCMKTQSELALAETGCVCIAVSAHSGLGLVGVSRTALINGGGGGGGNKKASACSAVGFSACQVGVKSPLLTSGGSGHPGGVQGGSGHKVWLKLSNSQISAM